MPAVLVCRDTVLPFGTPGCSGADALAHGGSQACSGMLRNVLEIRRSSATSFRLRP